MKELKVERTALIDGDIIAYEVAAWAMSAQADVLAMTERLTAQLEGWKNSAFCQHIIVALSCSKDDGFRRKNYPLYKIHRTTEPPPLLDRAKELLSENYKTVKMAGLEADDILGILATNGKVQNPVIVSTDKDLKQIPGFLFNPNKMDFPQETFWRDAAKLFFIQWMTGDSSDGYKGMDKCGPVKAEKLMADWDGTQEDGRRIVIEEYAAHPAKYTAEYVQQMARCAKILLAPGWDSEAKKPNLFTLTDAEQAQFKGR